MPPITFSLNGRRRAVDVEDQTARLRALRDALGLTGTLADDPRPTAP